MILFGVTAMIEDRIFRKSKFNLQKLKKYGFAKSDGFWIYEKLFMKDDFKAVVKVDNQGKVNGEVFDVASGDVYLPLRIENGVEGYSNKVRAEYEKILREIKNTCFSENNFVSEQANRLVNFIANRYGDKPDFPWKKYNEYGVFRNSASNKWYALIMNIDANKLADKKEGRFDVVNIKIDENKIPLLLKKDGFYPAYHMNKKNWITLILDGTIKDEDLFELLNESYAYTIVKKKVHP